MKTREFSISTDHEGMYNITARLREVIRESGVQSGLAVVYCPHTTAGPIDDVERVFDFGQLPEDETYETLAGFMMYMLRKIPKLTDKVEYAGYRFEVIDMEMNRIDQILVTKLPITKEDPD